MSDVPAGTLLARAGVPLDRCTFRGGDVVIHDPEGLGRIAEFKPVHLLLERRPG